jgi:hypothetical protein
MVIVGLARSTHEASRTGRPLKVDHRPPTRWRAGAGELLLVTPPLRKGNTRLTGPVCDEMLPLSTKFAQRAG